MYDVLLLLHLVAVVVGFGGVLLNGLYAAQAKKRPGPGGVAIAEANFFVSNRVAEMAIYLVPLFGFGLIGASDSAWSLSDSWILGALVLYVIGLLNAKLVLQPTNRRVIEMMRDGAPDEAAMNAADKRMAAAGGFAHLIFLVIMILMIWKPGA